MKEKYSVLMSVYYNENVDFFIKAVNSMACQTLPPEEIVIIIDGPIPDDLEKAINEYKNNNPYLYTIIRNEINQGLGISLQKGVVSCRNDIIARMDADDIALLDRCEKQLDFMQKNPKVSIVGGRIEEFIGDETNIVGKREVPCSHKEIKDYLKKRCPFNHMTVTFKKNDILAAGNYVDCFWNEDYYLWIRMYLSKCVFANLPDVLVHTRISLDTYQRRGGRKYFSSEMFIQKFMLKKGVINPIRYIINIGLRVVLQLFLPNKVRKFVYKTFARK